MFTSPVKLLAFSFEMFGYKLLAIQKYGCNFVSHLSCTNIMNHKNYKNLDHQVVKKTKFRIRVSTYVQGDLKNYFMDDCIKRGITEADLLRDILEIYYSSIKLKPYLVEKEMTEVKQFIIDRIKLGG